MKLTLQRDLPTHVCTPGTLYVDSTDRVAYTLERHPDDPEWSCIPPGTYTLVMAHSERFQMTLPHVLNVPGRTAIEIHAGNFPGDTHGCILVGQERGQDMVLKSRVALRALNAQIATSSGPHWITVIESSIRRGEVST